MAEQQQVIQSSTLPPAQPTYVLRGHTAQIHAVHFLWNNLRLLSGDADGWVILWSLTIKRPIAVWKAHDNAMLGLSCWEDERIITHGRDSKLHVWQLRTEDESELSTVMPIEDPVSERKQPWLLHTITVNTLNFCSFASCRDEKTPRVPTSDGILIATPGVQDGWINVTTLPSENRLATIPNPKDTNTGMVMAIGICYYNSKLLILAGYESGYACVWQQDSSSKKWQTIYMHKPHTQPVLSLGIALDLKCFFTSSADAIIARHPLMNNPPSPKVSQTKHAGQQSLTTRSDERILATAGWDGRIRIYSPKSMKEVAVLKWHKEGCYAVAFATTTDSSRGVDEVAGSKTNPTRRDLTVSERRTAKIQSTHWLAAGSKDGKVSLWDIY